MVDKQRIVDKKTAHGASPPRLPDLLKVRAGPAGLVRDAEVHRPGMEIDAAVESVLVLVEPHHGPPSGASPGCRYSILRSGMAAGSGEDMMIITALQRTRPAAAAFVLSSVHSAGRSAELGC